MITVNRVGESINVFVQGKDYTVVYSDENMKALNEISDKSEEVSSIEELNKLIEQVVELTKKSEDAFLQEECGLYKDPKTGRYHVMGANGKHVRTPVMKKLAERIVTTFDNKGDVSPLIKFFLRFSRNPKFKSALFREIVDNYIDIDYVRPDEKKKLVDAGFSDKVAEERATVKQVKITKEGLINCYKVSKEVDWAYSANEDGNKVKKNRYDRTFDPITGEVKGDSRSDIAVEQRDFYPAVQGMSGGDAFWCEGALRNEKGHIIKVGHNHRLESWDQVDCRDNVSCVPGLHVGGLKYIAGYSGEIHNVFIDPMYVGAIADDQSGAMRVKEYFVHSSFVGVTSALYHSSDYAKKSDASWDKIKEDLISKKQDEIDDIETK
jgi:hypothetical protein